MGDLPYQLFSQTCVGYSFQWGNLWFIHLITSKTPNVYWIHFSETPPRMHSWRQGWLITSLDRLNIHWRGSIPNYILHILRSIYWSTKNYIISKAYLFKWLLNYMFYNDNSQHTTSIIFKFLCYHLHLCHPIPACDIFPPKKMSDPFRPWVRPCACVGSGPKKIGRSVVAPEVPVGCHQPTPPPTHVPSPRNGNYHQQWSCLSMSINVRFPGDLLDQEKWHKETFQTFRGGCIVNKICSRLSWKWLIFHNFQVETMTQILLGQMSGMKLIYTQHFLEMGNFIGNLEWFFIRPPNFCLCPPRITIGSPSKKEPDIDPQVVRKKVV